jgi:small ligand-binding sensory domain FIST
MSFASALATGPDLGRAVAEAGAALGAALGVAPDLTLCFAAPDYGDALDGVPALIQRALPGTTLIGCTGSGVIGGGQEVEQRPAIALVGARLPGVTATPVALLDEPDDDDPLGIDPARRPTFLVLPDPFTSDPAALVEHLDARYPGSVVLGGLASGGRRPGDHRLFLADEVQRCGAVTLALSGALEVETVVAQGCRPIGQPMFATRAKGGVLHELDGRPALTVLEELAAAAPPADRALMRKALFLGVAMRDSSLEYRPGDFLVRNLIGADPASGAIAVAAELPPLAVVQFHVRDAEASTADLRQLLQARRAEVAPAGALLFSCTGRGVHLYGEEGHDSRIFRAEVGDVPLGGFFCNGEIGPVQGKTFLHGYTSSFGLFRPTG